MQRFYNIVKILYYLLTVFVGVFFLRGELLFGVYYTVLLEYAIPGYLFISGIMIGHIVAKLMVINNEDEVSHAKIYLKSFVIGSIIGIVLALAYTFLK